MMPDVDRKSVQGQYGPERVIALSDGVYAIALTLLILDVRLPELPQTGSSQEFEAALLALQPQLFSYALSFAVIGIFWLAHHRYFRYIKRVDSMLNVLNLLSLFWIAFIPFPTGLVGQYAPGQRAAVVVYAATMAAVGFSGAVLWVYAMRRHLIDETLPKRVATRFAWFAGVTPVIFAISIGIAYFNAEAAMWSWWLILLARIVASRLVR